MEQIELITHVRKSTGKGAGRALRRNGQIPAILYGPDMESTLLSVSQYDLTMLLKKGNVSQLLLNLTIKNGDTSTRMAMIKELQTHPVSRNLLHIDFYEVALNRKIKVSVPVVTKGAAPGVEAGGVLQIVRREIDVLCLPTEIPESIEIDINGLEIGESIHVEEISVEGNVEFPEDVNFTVVTVLSPKIEAEPEEEGEEVEAEAEAETGETSDSATEE